MQVLRTPDERFADLEGYDFAPHYATVTDNDGTALRIHYVDEGPRDAAPILLMHGDQDTVVLLDHSVLMKNALERAGKSVELLTFEGENHYFYRPQSRLRMLEALDGFLSKHLPAS